MFKATQPLQASVVMFPVMSAGAVSLGQWGKYVIGRQGALRTFFPVFLSRVMNLID